MGQDGGLGIVGQGQLALGPLPHDPRQPDAQGLVDPGEGIARGREPLGEILAHPDLLGPLAGTEHDGYHRITALPQVKPAPKATSRTSIPGLRRPVDSAYASAIGIDAAEVLP